MPASRRLGDKIERRAETWMIVVAIDMHGKTFGHGG